MRMGCSDVFGVKQAHIQKEGPVRYQKSLRMGRKPLVYGFGCAISHVLCFCSNRLHELNVPIVFFMHLRKKVGSRVAQTLHRRVNSCKVIRCGLSIF